MVMTGVNVNAAEQEYPPAEAVFPEEKVLQIENQIKNTPIYNDKDAEGNFSLKILVQQELIQLDMVLY